MKLAAAGILVVLACTLGAGSAHAEPSLDEYGAGAAPGPFQQLVQTACEVDVELRGAVATVELRQRIANPGPSALRVDASTPLGGLPRHP
jgi:hypothetical protein